MTSSFVAAIIANILYVPALLLYSFCLLFSFTAVLNFSNLHTSMILCFEYILMSGYTIVTRRIHLPKHKAPSQFSPSISFMGG
jgi:hypothetical protein